jgi:hypothetical protein
MHTCVYRAALCTSVSLQCYVLRVLAVAAQHCTWRKALEDAAEALCSINLLYVLREL